MQKLEEIALSKLILDENYCRQVLPFVKEEYFDTINHKILFEVVHKYVQEFDGLPEPMALKIEIEKRKDISEEILKEIEGFIDTGLDLSLIHI